MSVSSPDGQVVGSDTQSHMFRGPKAARLYKEERDAAIASGKLSSSTGKEQEVSVLRGGFAEFGQKHKVGTHERSYCLWSVQLILLKLRRTMPNSWRNGTRSHGSIGETSL